MFNLLAQLMNFVAIISSPGFNKRIIASIAAIPLATMANKEWGQIGSNYLRGLIALAIQGFFIMVCVGIYAVLVGTISVSDNIHKTIFSILTYTVILCFALIKTSGLSKSVMNAH